MMPEMRPGPQRRAGVAVPLLDFTDVSHGWLVLGNATWHTAAAAVPGLAPEIPGDTRRMSGSWRDPANRLEICICRFPAEPTD